MGSSESEPEDGDSGSEDESESDMEEGSEEKEERLEKRASAKTRAAAGDILQGGSGEGEGAPTKGLFALNFMKRAAERQRAEAVKDAKQVGVWC